MDERQRIMQLFLDRLEVVVAHRRDVPREGATAEVARGSCSRFYSVV